MSTHNLQLSDELASFVTARVASGQYPDASAVVNAALRLLERAQREYDDKMAALKAAITEGDASPDAEGDVFEKIREKYGLPQRTVHA